MKKNSKGFTLVELLAVIVIMAMIALITVPVVKKFTTKAKMKAFKTSVLSLEANQIIQNFNSKYKVNENVVKN